MLGVGLQDIETKKGELRYKKHFSRITQAWFVKIITDKKERIYLEDLMEKTTAIKTSNMAYPVSCMKDVPKTIVPIEKPDKREVIKNAKTCFRLYYVYIFLRYIIKQYDSNCNSKTFYATSHEMQEFFEFVLKLQ